MGKPLLPRVYNPTLYVATSVMPFAEGTAEAFLTMQIRVKMNIEYRQPRVVGRIFGKSDEETK